MKKLSSSILALLLGCAYCGSPAAATERPLPNAAPGKARCYIDSAEHAVLVGTPSAPVRTLVSRYADGGDALSQGIAALLDRDSGLAADIILIAATASPDQRIAIARGVVYALSRVAPDSAEARDIRSALRCADPNTRATIAFLENRLFARSGDNGRSPPMYIEGVSGFGAAGGYAPPPGPPMSPE